METLSTPEEATRENWMAWAYMIFTPEYIISFRTIARLNACVPCVYLDVLLILSLASGGPLPKRFWPVQKSISKSNI